MAGVAKLGLAPRVLAWALGSKGRNVVIVETIQWDARERRDGNVTLHVGLLGLALSAAVLSQFAAQLADLLAWVG
jgi:hypothetical protein